MKTVRQSTEECNKFNTANAEAIACGLVEEITPDQYIIEREQYARKQAEAHAAEDKRQAVVAAANDAWEVFLAVEENKAFVVAAANDAWKVFLAVEENKAFALRVTQTAQLSEYTPEMTFKGDMISYKGSSFTRAQWTAICDLRDANRKALEDLKASFVAANK